MGCCDVLFGQKMLDIGTKSYYSPSNHSDSVSGDLYVLACVCHSYPANVQLVYRQRGLNEESSGRSDMKVPAASTMRAGRTFTPMEQEKNSGVIYLSICPVHSARRRVTKADNFSLVSSTPPPPLSLCRSLLPFVELRTSTPRSVL